MILCVFKLVKQSPESEMIDGQTGLFSAQKLIILFKQTIYKCCL